MDDLIRMSVTVLMLAPMAYTDLVGRYVLHRLLMVSMAIALSFFAYDILSGELFMMDPALFLWYVIGLLWTGVFFIQARIGQIGMAEPVMTGTITMMNPQMNGFAVGVWTILVGFGMSILFVIVLAGWRNLADILHGRRFSRNMIFTYYKRRGEKFCFPANVPLARMLGFGQIGKITENADGRYEHKSMDGRNLLVDENEHGMRVMKGSPVIFFFCVAFAALSGLAVAGYPLDGLLRDAYGIDPSYMLGATGI